MRRRRIRHIAAAALLAITLGVSNAAAGPYLDSAAMLLEDSRRDVDWAQAHLYDTGLVTLAHDLAEARVRASRQLVVAKDAEKAHPHLLLSLELTERALAAALDSEPKRFLLLLYQAREEDKMFRAMLAQLKLSLPEIERCKR